MTLQEIEAALDSGQLFVPMWRNMATMTCTAYQARRNGATKRWKREPDRFRIPIKFKFRDCCALDQTARHGRDFIIAADRASAEMALRLLRCNRPMHDPFRNPPVY
jgi:hypothetical protein